MNDTFSFDVFLSHHRADKPRVLRLAERLKDKGLRVWLDDWVIKPGDDIFLAVEQGLQVSRALVLCMSPDALGSGWVGLERSTVLFRDPRNAERRFIPLLLADCELPDTLRRYKHVDYRRETNLALVELVSACRGIPLTAHGANWADIEIPGPADEEGARAEVKPPHEVATQRSTETQKSVRRRDILILLAIALTLFVALGFFVRWGTTSSSDVVPENPGTRVLQVHAENPFRVDDLVHVRIKLLRQSHLFCFILDQSKEAKLLYPTGEARERPNPFGPGEITFPDDFNPDMKLGPILEPTVQFFHCIATKEPLQGALKTKWFENTQRRDNKLATSRDVADDILSRLRKSEGYAENSAEIEILSK